MPKRFLIIIFALSISFFNFQVASGQDSDSDEDYPASIRKYSLTYYGGGPRILSPWTVAFADNNWEILLACLEGTTKKELKEKGVAFSDSQLMLLEVMRFLEIQENNLKTIFPILGSKKTIELRKEMRDLAVRMDKELRPEVEALANELKKIGRESSMFTILFSYALDDLPWDTFEEAGLVQDMHEISPQKPLWPGVYYACYPRRATRCGTNSESDHGVSFKLNWGGSGPKIGKYFNWDNLGILLTDYLDNGRIVNANILKELAETEIFDADGKLTIPVIKQTDADPLHLACKAVAAKTAKLYIDYADINGLKKKYGFHDKEKTVVFSYHEWMWEYMDYLVEKGIMQRPVHFEDSDKSTPKDIGALLIVVDSRDN